VTALRLDFEYGHSIDLVWQALTDRQLHRDWWIPSDLMPLEGGVFRAFPPTGLPGFNGPFDMDVVTVKIPVQLTMRWHGDETRFEVSWQLTPTSRGCRLRVTQQGFFGVSGDERREQLRRSYELLFAERLPLVLDRIAAIDPEPAPVGVPVTRPSGTAKVPQRAVEAPARDWRAAARGAGAWLLRVTRIPATSRVTLLSVAGVLVLTVLAVTALTTLLLRPAVLPAGAADAGRGPAQGRQPGIAGQSGTPAGSPSPSEAEPSTSPSPSPADSPSPAASQAGPAAESQTVPRVTARFGVQLAYDGGYIGTITITAGPKVVDVWSVRLVLPAGGSISSAWDQMAVSSSGEIVTITPQPVHRVIRAGQSFAFSFQVNLAPYSGDGIPTSCTVNGLACAGV
jgi:uncharacterized protein YndB with AHSA1/START domain